METLTTPDTGCLLLADITGYTSYLQSTELEHAQDVLADLLETLISTIQPVFTLSKLEGDAAFAYAEDGRVSPTSILDTVEVGYFAFRRRLRDIEHATSCQCNACVLIPSLDLKYFVHHGRYVARRIAGTEELTGSDVVLVHRLMKGKAGPGLGLSAYAVYTRSTIEAFGMDPVLLGFSEFVEDLPDVGEVPVLVQDMTRRWAFENERNRVYVTEGEADHVATWEVPVPREVAWEYMTSPEKRAKWSLGVTAFELQTPGRLGTGSINHCIHGADVIVEHIADWRPFDYYTVDYPLPHLGDGEVWRHTYEFKETEAGSRLTLRMRSLGPAARQWWEEVSQEWLASMAENGKALSDLLAEESARAEQARVGDTS